MAGPTTPNRISLVAGLYDDITADLQPETPTPAPAAPSPRPVAATPLPASGRQSLVAGMYDDITGDLPAVQAAAPLDTSRGEGEKARYRGVGIVQKAGGAALEMAGFAPETAARIKRGGDELIQENPPRVGKIEGIKDARDAGAWLWSLINEQLAVMGSVVGGAAAGAAIPIAAGASAPVIAGASALGAGAIGLGLNSGEIYENLRSKGIDPDEARNYALGFGAPAAALDLLLPVKGIGRLATGRLANEAAGRAAPGIARRMAKGGAQGLGLEGLTETGQTGLGLTAERMATGEFPEDSLSQLINAAAAGAATGGVFGAATSVRPEKAQPGPAPAPPPVKPPVNPEDMPPEGAPPGTASRRQRAQLRTLGVPDDIVTAFGATDAEAIVAGMGTPAPALPETVAALQAVGFDPAKTSAMPQVAAAALLDASNRRLVTPDEAAWVERNIGIGAKDARRYSREGLAKSIQGILGATGGATPPAIGEQVTITTPNGVRQSGTFQGFALRRQVNDFPTVGARIRTPAGQTVIVPPAALDMSTRTQPRPFEPLPTRREPPVSGFNMTPDDPRLKPPTVPPVIPPLPVNTGDMGQSGQPAETGPAVLAPEIPVSDQPSGLEIKSGSMPTAGKSAKKSFGEFRRLLPKDAAGDPDVAGVGAAAIAAVAGTQKPWTQLTAEQRQAVIESLQNQQVAAANVQQRTSVDIEGGKVPTSPAPTGTSQEQGPPDKTRHFGVVRPRPRPDGVRTLYSTILANGGLRDDEGHNIRQGVLGRRVSRLIRNGGMSVDGLGEVLAQEGWFGYGDDVTWTEAQVLDLIDLMARKGYRNVIHPDDTEAAYDANRIPGQASAGDADRDTLYREAQDLGIDIEAATDREIEAAISEARSEQEAWDIIRAIEESHLADYMDAEEEAAARGPEDGLEIYDPGEALTYEELEAIIAAERGESATDDTRSGAADVARPEDSIAQSEPDESGTDVAAPSGDLGTEAGDGARGPAEADAGTEAVAYPTADEALEQIKDQMRRYVARGDNPTNLGWAFGIDRGMVDVGISRAKKKARKKPELANPDQSKPELPTELPAFAAIAQAVDSQSMDITPIDKGARTHEVGDGLYESYRPQRMRIAGAQPHPADLVQSAAMASVLPPKPTYVPALPQSIATKGLLSDAQIENVIYAGQAHEQMLPAANDEEKAKRRGYFIGDGTGVGKGRQVAAIIEDNRLQGRKKAIWISEKWPLLKDARRDYAGIGGDPKRIIDGKKLGPGATIAGDGIFFTTYDTLKQEPKDKATRLNQLVEWVGEDFDGVIVLDESHNMGNAVPLKGKRGSKKPSAKALTGVELQNRLPLARVVYASATGATEVSNLSYADRLGLWGPGTPFDTRAKFISQMEQGGVAAMELVARDLKALGLYASRSLSFEGVEQDRLEHELTADQRAMYDELARAWQLVLKNINQALEVTHADGNKNAKAAALSAFWGGHQRFFNQVITAMKMTTVLDAIKDDLANDWSVVMQLVSTNEAAQDRALGKLEADQDYDDLDMSPRDQLLQLVQNAFPVAQHELVETENGTVKTRPVLDSNGNPVENAEAVAMRDRLLDKLSGIKVPDAPIEYAMDQLGVEKVAEITGRKQRFVKKEGRTVRETRPASANTAEADAFMSGDKPTLIFSQAGGTGRSYHAERTAKNQKRRRHYLIQGGWRADQAIQGFGRTHRTNQSSAPWYRLTSTNLKGEKRFISSIARRLDQLGALTKGQRQTGGQGLFSEKDNLESEYASEALRLLINDMRAGKTPGLNFSDFLEQTGLNIIDPNTGALIENKMPDIPQFLNRLLSLTIEMQDKVFDAFAERMDAAIERAVAAGSFDVGVETLRADKAEVVENRVVHTDERSGAETRYVQLQLSYKNNPLTFEKAKEGRKGRPVAFWALNKKSGKIYAFVDNGTATDGKGRVLRDYRRQGVNNYNFANEEDVLRNFTKMPERGAKEYWDREYEATPKFRQETEHLITGALLPVWDRLPATQSKVYRVKTDSGESFLGRMVPDSKIAETLKNLGAEATAPKLTPQQIIGRILNGATATLSNGWRLVKRRVGSEDRIELLGPDVYGDRRTLEPMGVQFERIGYNGRLFIPTGSKAEAALSRVMMGRALVGLANPKNDEESFSTRPAKAQEQQAPAPEAPAQARPATKKLRETIADLARQISGGAAEFKLEKVIYGEGEGLRRSGVLPDGAQPVAGSFDPLTNLISISLDTRFDPLNTTSHELWHWLKRNRFFTRDEVQALERERNQLVEIARGELPGFDVDGMTQEELEATAFAYYVDGRLRGAQAKGLLPGIRRAFDRLWQFLSQIKTAIAKLAKDGKIDQDVLDVLAGRIKLSADNVFERALQGEIAARPIPQMRRVVQMGDDRYEVILPDWPHATLLAYGGSLAAGGPRVPATEAVLFRHFWYWQATTDEPFVIDDVPELAREYGEHIAQMADRGLTNLAGEVFAHDEGEYLKALATGGLGRAALPDVDAAPSSEVAATPAKPVVLIDGTDPIEAWNPGAGADAFRTSGDHVAVVVARIVQEQGSVAGALRFMQEARSKSAKAIMGEGMNRPPAEVNLEKGWYRDEIRWLMENQSRITVQGADGTSYSARPAATRAEFRGNIMTAQGSRALDWVNQVVGNRMSPLGALPEQERYLIKRYRTLGKIGRVEDDARKLYELLRTATKEQAQAIYLYLTTAGATPDEIGSRDLEAAAVEVKRQIGQQGRELVRRGLIPEEAYDKYKDTYLPRVYLKHLIDREGGGVGRGLRAGDMGYVKGRKDIPEDVRAIILGEVKDPAFLAARGLGLPGRDMAILDFLEQVAGESAWIFPPSLTTWRGRPVSVIWLTQEAERLRRQAQYIEGEPERAASMQALARELDDLAEPHLEALGKAPKDYRQIPASGRYGMLAGMWVRKEIYNDVVGAIQFVGRDTHWMQRMFEVGGPLTKVTQLWKLSKVALNPPTIARNIMSNAVLLQLSGVPMHRVVTRLSQALREIISGGEYYQIAKKYGVSQASFAHNEMFSMQREFVDLERDSSHPMARLRRMADLVSRVAGQGYQFTESWFKVAKIIDAMQSDHMNEAEAALEGHKWLFDYSLVPPTVQYLRNAPIGVPFLTFYYKAMPRLLEVAMTKPWRYAPYFAMMGGLYVTMLSMYGVTGDDLDALKKALPEWLQKRGHTYVLPFKDDTGRWQVVDLGYLFPWGMVTDVATSVGEGNPLGVMQATGLFGGPVPDLLAAIKTGIDPFTKRQIADERDPPAKQAADIMNYLWRMAAPTWVTDIGAAAALYRTITGTPSRTGDPPLSATQAGMRFVGINVYPLEPDKSRAQNLRRLQFEVREIQTRMRWALRDQSLSPEARDRTRESYMDHLREKTAQLQTYTRESAIPPQLRTR